MTVQQLLVDPEALLMIATLLIESDLQKAQRAVVAMKDQAVMKGQEQVGIMIELVATPTMRERLTIVLLSTVEAQAVIAVGMNDHNQATIAILPPIVQALLLLFILGLLAQVVLTQDPPIQVMHLFEANPPHRLQIIYQITLEDSVSLQTAQSQHD